MLQTEQKNDAERIEALEARLVSCGSHVLTCVELYPALFSWGAHRSSAAGMTSRAVICQHLAS